MPVMFGDAALTAFSFSVVPRGLARIRVQLSAAHTPKQIGRCVAAFLSSRAPFS